MATKKSKKATKGRTTKRTTTRSSTKRPTRPTRSTIREGTVTHTELASSDPRATKEWCAAVLGWKIQTLPMPGAPGGAYHMWQTGKTGGGIRMNNPPEQPGTIPYCETADIRDTYNRAIKAGAIEMMAPDEIPGGMGWIAIVQAPGGVPVGFWAPSK